MTFFESGPRWRLGVPDVTTHLSLLAWGSCHWTGAGCHGQLALRLFVLIERV